jgi:hypothetical protein
VSRDSTRESKEDDEEGGRSAEEVVELGEAKVGIAV